MIGQLLALAASVLGLGMGLRWLLERLLGVRVTLVPTSETTPHLTDEMMRPGWRRLILSDMHLGAGDRLDDFRDDALFVSFIEGYALDGVPTELILAGDTFEFLQVRVPHLNDYDWSSAAAAQRLRVILHAHPTWVAALRTFLAAPDTMLTVLIGNHDFELHYQSAKTVLREALGLPTNDIRLRFGISYTGDGVYLEHGNQFDPWNRFAYFDGISTPFEVVRGTRIVKDVINRLEDDPLPIAPQIDNIKPVSAFFWYLLALPRLRDAAVRRFVVRGLLMFFRVNVGGTRYMPPILTVRQELLGTPTERPRREAMLGAVYAAEPALREAAAATSGGREPQLAPGVAALSAGVQTLGGVPMITQAEMAAEAQSQLSQEIRAFNDATAAAMAEIAARPAMADTQVFVCGHTHLAGVYELGTRQTYYNTGTWTPVLATVAPEVPPDVQHPFLDVRTVDGALQSALLIWRGPDMPPVRWQDTPGTTTKEDLA